MSEAFRARAATADDARAIVAFNLAMARETEGRELDSERLARGVRRALADPARGRYLLAVDAGGVPRAALLVTTEWSDWRNGEFWWIQSVYVAPEARRRGAFATLWARVEAEARRDPDCCGLRLYVERENARAQATYAALGMIETDYRLWEIDFTDRAGDGA